MDKLVKEDDNFCYYETKYGVGYVVSKSSFFYLSKEAVVEKALEELAKLPKE